MKLSSKVDGTILLSGPEPEQSLEKQGESDWSCQVVKLKEENLMYSAMQEKEVQETKDTGTGSRHV